VSPTVKYSNWLVVMILLVFGGRVLFVVLRWVLGSNDSWREGPWVPLAHAIQALLFLIAATGVFRWRDWGRSLAIALCAWNVFVTAFLTLWPPGHRTEVLSVCGVLVLVIIWFYLPKIKLQFVRPG
jgi:uncharacterized membrane protein YhaH (DUF805 family)